MGANKTSAPDDSCAVDASQVELALGQIDSLPTLPAVAVRLLEMTSDDRLSGRELAQLIESDPSLSARVLSVVSRADVGARARSVEQAVLFLGFNAIRSLVLAIQVFDTFSERVHQGSDRLDRKGVWRHALAVGCAARLFADQASAGAARDRPAVHPEEAFVCGLLHDLGKVVLDACFPKSYERVVARVTELREPIVEAERKVFGLDHLVAGQRLAEYWKLPSMISEAIWLHHHTSSSTPTRIGHARHVRLVQLADGLAREMRIGFSGTPAGAVPTETAAEALGLTGEMVAAVMDALPAEIEARAEVIGLDRITSNEVYREALARTNGELADMNVSLALANRELQERSRTLAAMKHINTSVGAASTHADVCRAGAEAMATVLGDRSVTVLGRVVSRSVIAIQTACGDKTPTPHGMMIPSSDVGDLDKTDLAVGQWRPANVLSAALLDRLAALMGEPATWVWPIDHEGGRLGVIATGPGPLPGGTDSTDTISEMIGARLAEAEARLVAQQLGEELAELNRALTDSQAELARSRSLAMVGEMAAGAAHEMNNPLAVISGQAQIIAGLDVPEAVREKAGKIAEQARKATEIVLDLMSFAKPTPAAPQAFDLGELLQRVRANWLSKSVLRPEEFRLQLSDGGLPCWGDASQIETLFDEVIANAIEAMAESKDRRLVVDCGADLAEEKIVAAVQDNGCGMTPDILERAMDPFFSHRQAGRGRGLGLSRASRYAEINKGRIRLSSRTREGTTVVIELRATKAG